MVRTLFAYAKQKGIKTILLNLYNFISSIEVKNELIDLSLIKQKEENEKNDDRKLLNLFEKIAKMKEIQNKKRNKRRF